MLQMPSGVSLDSYGNIFITDAGNDRIRVVVAATGVISTIAGTGVSAYSGDGGLATSANLYLNSGQVNAYELSSNVAVSSSGVVYIADSQNNRIRAVTWVSNQTTASPSISPTPLPTRSPTTITTAIPSLSPVASPMFAGNCRDHHTLMSLMTEHTSIVHTAMLIMICKMFTASLGDNQYQ